MNNIVTLNNGQAVTTSLAIAEGTENEHASVIKLVRTYQADLSEFGRVGFEIAPFETAGGMQSREVAILNEQQATLLLTYMRNSEIVRRFKMHLVKAFFELAKATKPADPMEMLSNPAAMRNLLLGYTEKVIELESELEETKPKAQALDRLATVSDGSLCITDAAKQLQMRPKDLFACLSINQWIYRRTGCANWIAYQDKIQQGLLEHKTTEVTRSDGSTKISDQVRILPKGLTKLAERMEAA